MFPFSSTKRGERQAAACIYAAALAAARRPALFTHYGVPDTLEGRFEMVTLHLFAVLHRLMHDPGDDPDLARHVSESFVEDMEGAYREMGVSDLSVPKRMRKLYGAFAGRIGAYREALKDANGGLAAAIERNVFPDAPEARNAAALAAFLSEAVGAVRTADMAALRRGEVPYPALSGEEGGG